jgi:hypothetical protein
VIALSSGRHYIGICYLCRPREVHLLMPHSSLRSATVAAHHVRVDGGIGASPSGSNRSSTVLIATRASADTKRRFRALASQRGLTESALLMLMIDRVLARHAAEASEPAVLPRSSQTSRMSLRLRPGDFGRLRERAGSRRMKPATYLAALLHVHLAANPPLPVEELAELKRLVAQLGVIARALQRAGDAGHRECVPAALASDLAATRAAVQAARADIRALVQASLRSWESGDG